VVATVLCAEETHVPPAHCSPAVARAARAGRHEPRLVGPAAAGAVGLSQYQLGRAFGDDSTILPDSFLVRWRRRAAATPDAAAFFDVTKPLKEFDLSKVVAEFFKQYKLSGIDLDALVASQKKNLEALTSANRVAFEGLEAVAKQQAEILQETMNEASKVVDQLSKSGSPPDVAARQTELAKSAFERALANMRELAEMVSKANQEASNTVKSRISASLDEIKEYARKLKSPAE
jgi:phasin family protein